LAAVIWPWTFVYSVFNAVPIVVIAATAG